MHKWYTAKRWQFSHFIREKIPYHFQVYEIIWVQKDFFSADATEQDQMKLDEIPYTDCYSITYINSNI